MLGRPAEVKINQHERQQRWDAVESRLEELRQSRKKRVLYPAHTLKGRLQRLDLGMQEIRKTRQNRQTESDQFLAKLEQRQQTFGPEYAVRDTSVLATFQAERTKFQAAVEQLGPDWERGKIERQKREFKQTQQKLKELKKLQLHSATQRAKQAKLNRLLEHQRKQFSELNPTPSAVASSPVKPAFISRPMTFSAGTRHASSSARTGAPLDSPNRFLFRFDQPVASPHHRARIPESVPVSVPDQRAHGRWMAERDTFVRQLQAAEEEDFVESTAFLERLARQEKAEGGQARMELEQARRKRLRRLGKAFTPDDLARVETRLAQAQQSHPTDPPVRDPLAYAEYKTMSASQNYSNKPKTEHASPVRNPAIHSARVVKASVVQEPVAAVAVAVAEKEEVAMAVAPIAAQVNTMMLSSAVDMDSSSDSEAGFQGVAPAPFEPKPEMAKQDEFGFDSVQQPASFKIVSLSSPRKPANKINFAKTLRSRSEFDSDSDLSDVSSSEEEAASEPKANPFGSFRLKQPVGYTSTLVKKQQTVVNPSSKPTADESILTDDSMLDF
jgi:hypothetical protein